MARTPASGIQHHLRAGDYEADIAGVGATLRSLTHAGRDLIVPFAADEVRPAHRGATLAPWPNRVVDGAYSFGGRDFQLPLTEPARSHALHGLATWQHFRAIDEGADHVTLEAVIEPQTAYPWRLVVRTRFALSADGLTQTVTVENVSDAPAPWGTAPHPYLVAGDGPLDQWVLELPAERVLAVTDDRLIPTELRDVAADDPARFDFRVPRTIGDAEIDHAYTGLVRDGDGCATVRVTTVHGTGVLMQWGVECPWVQVHTADRPVAAENRLGLAVEPMTCAPDAFNASRYDYDAGLIVLEPAQRASASWRIAAIV
ncbi:aldose 1-epimerase family protein [Microbacterium sp. SSW1-59]|uniref:aldose 1-epimerase family protein n=1 Tax=Microbacterium xanthum TaxID=3079794 RepID=UPI002AD24560|nr:aldose 1-epimerase family protein [Microbacterium sp. SSW1-59]MDZ8200226.1 aldose 1-epimerase family protein [Microbacterium sp. SSW1-59]